MNLSVIIAGSAFTVLSTIMLSYISIATMVGPWIAPTLVLLGHIIFGVLGKNKQHTENVTLSQAIGAGGGIVATGIGFSLPMLYFMDKNTFSELIQSPTSFCITIAALTLVAGSLGLLMGHWLAGSFIDKNKQPFPVSTLTHNIISSGNNRGQARLLIGGITISGAICALRDGVWLIPSILKKNYYVLTPVLGDALAISVWPTLWAIGFTVGIGITLPLFYGLLCKYLVMYPLVHHGSFIGYSFFSVPSTEVATVAFCSGLVASDLIFSIPTYLKQLIGLKWTEDLKKFFIGISQRLQYKAPQTKQRHLQGSILIWGIVLIGSSALLTYFNFTAQLQLLTLLFTAIATYSICEIGGRIGMIPFGRYSTFIVVPLLLLFQLTPLQSTIVCVFFNICAAAASDTLFDYKTADLSGINRRTIMVGQIIGLVITAITIGAVLWLLFTHLELGSEALFGQRGKAKALLLQTLHFEKILVVLGILFGRLLKILKVNSAMVFGGLIMPNSVTLGLLAGSLITFLTKKRDFYQPFCAGALAAESLWVLILIILGVFGLK